jgi:hypothetical protein
MAVSRVSIGAATAAFGRWDILTIQINNPSRNTVGASGQQRLLAVTPTLKVSSDLRDIVCGKAFS